MSVLVWVVHGKRVSWRLLAKWQVTVAPCRVAGGSDRAATPATAPTVRTMRIENLQTRVPHTPRNIVKWLTLELYFPPHRQDGECTIKEI